MKGYSVYPLSGSFVLLPWPWRSHVGFFPCAGVRVDDIELRVAPSGFTDEYGCLLGEFSLNANNIKLHRVRPVFAGVHGVNGLVLPAFGDVGGTGCFPVICDCDLLVSLFVVRRLRCGTLEARTHGARSWRRGTTRTKL